MEYKQGIVNFNSIKSIYIVPCFNEVELASATGFVVNNLGISYLITNRHVVTGRNNENGKCLDEINCAIPNKIKIWLPYHDGILINWKVVEIFLQDENGEDVWIEHPNLNSKVDVVAIKLEFYKSTEFCYDMLSSYNPIVTENVFIIGYPYGFNINPNIGKYAIWTSGIIASDPALNLNIGNNQLPGFLIDAKTRSGQSGSPVIYYNFHRLGRNDTGFGILPFPIMHEIGIYSGRINKDSDLGYVWKWSVIKEIILERS